MKNIRQILENHLDTKGITKAFVAKQLKMSQQNFQSKISKNHFSTEFVITLSKTLKHDFFKDLSNELISNEVDLLDVLSIPTKPLTQDENEAYLLAKMNKLLDDKIKDITNNMVNKNEVRLVIDELKHEIVEIKEHFAQKEKSIKKTPKPYDLLNESSKFSINE